MRPARVRSLGIGRLPTPAWATLTLLLGLFAAAPAQAQVWSATLTVDQANIIYFGCDNNDPDQDDCSSSTVLTDDDFTYGGTTYTIEAIYWRSDVHQLTLDLDLGALTAQEITTALGSLTLNVGGTALAFSDASVSSTSSIYRNLWTYDPALDWTDGQMLSLSLTPPPAGGAHGSDGDAGQREAGSELDGAHGHGDGVRRAVHVGIENRQQRGNGRCGGADGQHGYGCDRLAGGNPHRHDGHAGDSKPEQRHHLPGACASEEQQRQRSLGVRDGCAQGAPGSADRSRCVGPGGVIDRHLDGLDLDRFRRPHVL